MTAVDATPGLGWQLFATTHDERTDRLMKESSMSTRLVLAVLAALLALPMDPTASPVEAKKRPRTVTRTFRDSLPIEQIAMVTTSPVSATPYPAALFVDGLKGKIRDVNVRLNDLSHIQPGDLEVLLVGPGGQSAIVMADVGGDADVEGVTLLLDDEAAAPLPSGILQSGAFRPTNASGNPIAFNAPAPSAGANAALSVFDGADPNGIWRLYVQDDHGPAGIGYFEGGWDLEITTKAKKKKRR
jgi:subtilisin-like proprotein convertase family protein